MELKLKEIALKKLCESEPLVIELDKLEDGIIHFRIKYQRYRNKNFFNGNRFKAKDGLELISIIYPERSLNIEDTIYVQGADKSHDNNTIEIFLYDYLRMIQAVKEYNEARLKLEKRDV